MLFNYDISLVLLAIIISGIAFYVSFWLCKAGARKKHYCWPLFSGPTMGCGIWVLHYMVIQAHHHSHVINYNIQKTLASLLIAIVGCSLGFVCFLFKRLRGQHYLLPALIFSATAASMHYLGMAAIINAADWYVSNTKIILSLIAIFITSLVMLRLTHLMLVITNKNDIYANFYRLSATLTLCCGVAIMHFLGSCDINMGSIPMSSMPKDDYVENTIAMTLIVLVALVFLLAIFIWFVNFKEHLSNELLKRELIKKNLQLKQMTQHDSLTQLPNRLYLQKHLNTLFTNQTDLLFIMFIDLDGFKRVNDVWGHAVGDELLVKISQTLKENISREGFVARIGGDEFIVVVCQKDKQVVIQLAKKLLARIADNYELSATSVDFISASIGISIYPEHGNDVATLLKKADVAMYYIKNRGKNSITFYDEIEMTLPS
ncbi:diguanylate cyclase (GGDEF)-like protein [Buttiauxella sp. JUb87]|uniref:sensor domain-containing diguanylate cyclase n=1 Tax=Buttiauxella sp. JUb87 TaxID=2485129 RepID=UPI0010620F87|nr:diguanylate cyclase [Buttiauxella sp. JUb87]TDN52936.1 diguanylate cyclase (GGDEF)-like protein [Buttiauxella sp. JUb87]